MEEKFKKIVVKTEDELIDIVRDISGSDSKRLLVTFAEDSDILISSINLKVLLDTADEKESLLVMQIINNPTGIRNAKLAGITVFDKPTSPEEEDWLSAQDDYNTRIQINSKKEVKLPDEYKSENITSFEQRVNSVLSKNKENRLKGGSSVVGVEDDIDFVVDQDITTTNNSSISSEQEDLTKVDFKHVPDPIKRETKKKFSLPKIFNKKPRVGNDNNIVVTNNIKDKIFRLLPKIVIPLVVVIFLVAFLYYKFAPYVKVTIFVQSKPVEVEKIFTGNENINEIDFENLEIPIKNESITKSVSDSVTATGIAYKGEKAKGSIAIMYFIPSGCTDADEPITLSSGNQVVSATDSKKYVLTSGITVTCGSYGNNNIVNVEAIEVGEEYNIAAGKSFSISGYDISKISAVNSTAFTGGSKEEYTVLSQKDVNDKAKELEVLAKEEATNGLTEVSNGWEMIEATLKSEIKEGSIKPSVAIGSEVSVADLSLEVEASATFYYTRGVDDGLNTLLTEAALNQNLFESSDGLKLTLTGDIVKELTVEEGSDPVSIKLVASSAVEPSVEREDLINDLRGLSWEDGNKYLRDLTFTSKDPVIKFTPESFPSKLRHFPSKQGRIDILIEDYSPESI
jgi:hypothetical protein